MKTLFSQKRKRFTKIEILKNELIMHQALNNLCSKEFFTGYEFSNECYRLGLTEKTKRIENHRTIFLKKHATHVQGKKRTYFSFNHYKESPSNKVLAAAANEPIKIEPMQIPSVASFLSQMTSESLILEVKKRGFIVLKP
jgi:hypothetical protein